MPLLLAQSHAAHAYDTELPETWNSYGELGLLDMPDANMAPDGQLTAIVDVRPDVQHYNAAFQVLPWFEGTFRYSRISTPTIGYYDRSIGMKIRLFQEGDYMPAVSMGIRDILGTGIYSSEYFVASKRVWQLDFTAGLGWGRLGERGSFENPFALLFPSFKNRVEGGNGTVDLNKFFHGPDVGLFGGVSWATPIDGLSVLAEYSSDKYELEKSLGGGPTVRSPLNVGLSYEIASGLTASGGWYYGSTWGAIVSFSVDPTQNPKIRFGADLPQPTIRSDLEQTNAITDLIKPYGNSGKEMVEGRVDGKSVATAAVISELGVRGAEIDHDVLMVDVGSARNRSDICEKSGQLAQNAGAKISTVAVVDYLDPQGHVEVCSVPRLIVVNDVQGEAGDTPGFTAAKNSAGTAAVDKSAVASRIQADLEKQGIYVLLVTSGKSDLSVYYENDLYFRETEAAGRIARVLMVDAPPDVEIFHLISIKVGVPMRSFQVMRSALERESEASSETPKGSVELQLPSMDDPLVEEAMDNSYPRFHWRLAPQFRESVFNPSAPFEFQVLADASAWVELLPGLRVDGIFDRNIYNNFVFEQPDSALPHVRSDITYYLKDGENAITQLSASYRARLTPDLYAEVTAGYLEMMYAGGGGQLLWRPDDSRFALGMDVYAVQMRGFDQLIDLRHYRVITGHISAYYQSPYYGLNFAIHAGRYLAGDHGATFEISREFSTGVEIGFFATFTNVPFSEFGEGSFDKGIFLRVPLEWALPINSTSAYDLELHSLTRDGGQRLANDDSLYDETRATSYGEIAGNLDNVVSP